MFPSLQIFWQKKGLHYNYTQVRFTCALIFISTLLSFQVPSMQMWDVDRALDHTKTSMLIQL